MKRKRAGFTLIELICTMAVSAVVMTVGFQIYFGVNKVQDIESKRESAMLAAQNLMILIKQDVRAASSVVASGDSLLVTGTAGKVSYSQTRNRDGVQRISGRHRRVFRGTNALFTQGNGGSTGVRVRISSSTTVHRRPIRIEISSFVSPRNR